MNNFKDKHPIRYIIALNASAIAMIQYIYERMSWMMAFDCGDVVARCVVVWAQKDIAGLAMLSMDLARRSAPVIGSGIEAFIASLNSRK